MLDKYPLLEQASTLIKRKPSVAVSSVIGLLLVLVLSSTDLRSSQQRDAKSFSVEQMDLVQTVLARGEIKPAAVIPIKSQIVGNKSKLVWLESDGSVVQQGDIIARFDTTPFTEELEKLEQQKADATVTLSTAKKTLQIYIEDDKKRKDNATKQYEVAQLKAKDLLSGSGVIQKERLELEVKQAQRAHKIAVEELDDYQVLLDKGHVSSREHQKAKDNERKFAEQKRMKEKELANFNQYEWPKLKREAEILEESAKLDYQRALRLSELEVVKFQGQVVKAERDLDRINKRMDKVQINLLACDVKAPINGVIYYQTLPRPEGRRKIQVGDNVWAGQTFIEMPDTNRLVLETTVREYEINRLKAGNLAEITLDAFNDKSIKAKVEKINSMVMEEDNDGISRFLVRVALMEDVSNIHIGMSGQASISANTIKNALVVPIELVHEQGTSPWVWKQVDDEKQKVFVQLGASNHQWQQILQGVEAGEIVYQ